MRKPRLLKDWDDNRKIVITPYGQRLTLFNQEAMRVYLAGVKVYKRHKKR